MSTYSRKKGVASPESLSNFINSSHHNYIIVDARNLDFKVEPGDEGTHERAPIAGTASGYRPRAVNAPYDRSNECMDLSVIPEQWIADAGGKDKLFVITHCGGGGRGQKAKEFAERNGFTNVINGGGPEDLECWEVFGDK